MECRWSREPTQPPPPIVITLTLTQDEAKELLSALISNFTSATAAGFEAKMRLVLSNALTGNNT